MGGTIPLLVITGATATGKTAVALEAAALLRGEIISGDSMQVYRGMDIGTAKPTPSERAAVPHHLIDIIYPNQPFSVADFQRLAMRAIRDVHSRNRLPILTGGTALYIRAVVDQYHFPDAPPDERLRQDLAAIAEQHGDAAVHRILASLDPTAAARIHPNDRKRIIRAIEIRCVAGKPMSEIAGTRALMPLRPLIMAMDMSREEMYARIDERVDRMIEAGLVEEVRGLIQSGLSRRLFSMQALGYREIGDYLEGLSTLDGAIRLLKRNTRHFSRRQITWFRRDKRIKWVWAGDDRPRGSLLAEITSLVEGEWLTP